MQVGLKKALSQALTNLKINQDDPLESSALKGFCFNEALKVEQCLEFPFTVSPPANSIISIGIPACHPLQSISVPIGTRRVEIQALALSFSFDHQQSFYEIAEVLSFPYY